MPYLFDVTNNPGRCWCLFLIDCRLIIVASILIDSDDMLSGASVFLVVS